MAVIKPINKSSIKMRIHFSVLAIGLTGLALVAPSPVKSNDFKPRFGSCRELQRYANEWRWSPPRSFQGFENAQIEYTENGQFEECWPGYSTTSSPMGTQVCQLGLIYSRSGKLWTQKHGGCRWRD